ncbi:MAG: hypothetical protein HQ512_04610, partial [Rhodospirillales bacterium]|nr:hypothetical protein [Rhodospirillales bacterium]
GVIGALSAFYHDSLDIHDPEHRQLAIYRLIAKMPTIAAYAYKYSLGHPRRRRWRWRRPAPDPTYPPTAPPTRRGPGARPTVRWARPPKL